VRGNLRICSAKGKGVQHEAGGVCLRRGKQARVAEGDAHFDRFDRGFSSRLGSSSEWEKESGC